MESPAPCIARFRGRATAGGSTVPSILVVATVVVCAGCGEVSQATRTHPADSGAVVFKGTGGAGGGFDASTLPPECRGPLTFGDPNIEAQIRETLDAGPSPITAEQAQAVVSINVPRADSLAGLECLANLHGVTIRGGAVADLSPLASARQLSTVDIENGQIKDLSPLSGHPLLANIVVPNNQIASVVGLTLTPQSSNTCTRLILTGNPIGPDQLTYPCSLSGWYTAWGGTSGITADSCGNDAPCIKP
jgi:hypothetical protein